MSFGWSANDLAALARLAYSTVQNCRKACGEYDDLTRQVSALRGAIRHLRDEAADETSLLRRPGGRGQACWEELRGSLEGSDEVLRTLKGVLEKYVGVRRKEWGIGRFWTRAKFGNKELGTLNDLRQKARFFTGVISAVLSTAAVGSLGRIERQFEEAGLRELKPVIEAVAGKLTALGHGEGSVLTAYSNDDRAVWKELRRELVKEKIVPSDIISKNKDLITGFIRELGERGVLDDPEPTARDAGSMARDLDDLEAQVNAEDECYSEKDESTDTKGYSEFQQSPSLSKKDDSTKNKNRRSKADGSKKSGISLRENEVEQARSSRKVSRRVHREKDGGRFSKVNSDMVENHGRYHRRTLVDSSSPSSSSYKVFDFILNQAWKLAFDDLAQAYKQLSFNRNERGDRMTSMETLILDRGAHMPALLEMFSLVAGIWDSDRYDFTREGEEVRLFFCATPWGICLIYRRYNWSIILEWFKILYSLLEDCVGSMETLTSASGEALSSGELGNDLQVCFDTLQRVREEGLKEFTAITAPCDHETCHLPPLKSSPSASELDLFCDELLQHVYDLEQLQPITELELSHLGICIPSIMGDALSWIAHPIGDVAEEIRFLSSRMDPPQVDPVRLHDWIQQCASTDWDSLGSNDDELGELWNESP